MKLKSEGNLLVSCGAKLKFELQRDNEVYQKNVKIGEQISILLKSENIPEMSLSKQNKFCLELFRAQKANNRCGEYRAPIMARPAS